MTTDNHDNRQLDEILARSYQALRDEVPGQRQAVLSGLAETRSGDRRARQMRPVRAVLLALAACSLLRMGTS